MSDTPKVSVCIVTYNHQNYIEQALLSALTQRTKFEFEVIVGDDASTDGTVAVIKKVAARFPNLRVIAHPRNVGVKDNYLSVHNSARGEYVAHLDGDDYWLPGKLQAQVACLEAHPECAVAWHPMITFDERGLHHIVGDHGELLRKSLGKDYVELKDAVAAYGITGYHSSLMYRRSARTLFEYSASRFLIDYRLSLSLLESGAGYHMRRPFGCYRAFHDHSATRGGTDVVGPGLLLTLSDYAASHPHLKPQIVAHCLSVFFRRGRFQARLVGLLLTRLGQLGKRLAPLGNGAAPATDDPSAVEAKRIFHDNISLKHRLVGQYRFFANSTRFISFGLRQKTAPSLQDAVRAFRVGAYLSRPVEPKAGFFEKKYGEPPRKTSP
jgi:glycosyltransferase involved in cell wall biosynthesis